MGTQVFNGRNNTGWHIPETGVQGCGLTAAYGTVTANQCIMCKKKLNGASKTHLANRVACRGSGIDKVQDNLLPVFLLQKEDLDFQL